ncbi:Dps family protein [Pseudorhodobacter aquimaris]|uniref:Dps family protein n=1 Tax=Pseudorhodobacter aquimaris TaxID=687412 RepID=UPI00067E5B8D|nr:Dps family protein [Pseudorhodobacter aquimaris]
MSDEMNVTPQADKVKTGITKTKALADGLTNAVADTYRLVFKTHAYHWNVEGPMFFSIHHLTEEQYNDMFAAADVVAERIRALGHLAPMSLSAVMEMSVIKDLKETPSAQEMVEDLAKDHTTVARRFHELITLAEENNDPVTADLATARSAFHEQAAWMLRATSK